MVFKLLAISGPSYLKNQRISVADSKKISDAHLCIIGGRGEETGGETCEEKRTRDRKKERERKRQRGRDRVTEGKRQRGRDREERQRGRA